MAYRNFSIIIVRSTGNASDIIHHKAPRLNHYNSLCLQIHTQITTLDNMMKRKTKTGNSSTSTQSNASTTSLSDKKAKVCTPSLSSRSISTKVASSPFKYDVGDRGTQVALVHSGYELLLVLRNAGKDGIELTTQEVYTLETYMEEAIEAFDLEEEFSRVIGTDVHFTVGSFKKNNTNNNQNSFIGGIREYYYCYDAGENLPGRRGVSLTHQEMYDMVELLFPDVESDSPDCPHKYSRALVDIMERSERAPPNVTISDTEALQGYMKAGDYTVVKLATGELLLVEKLILLTPFLSGGAGGTDPPVSDEQLKKAVLAAIDHERRARRKLDRANVSMKQKEEKLRKSIMFACIHYELVLKEWGIADISKISRRRVFKDYLLVGVNMQIPGVFNPSETYDMCLREPDTLVNMLAGEIPADIATYADFLMC